MGGRGNATELRKFIEMLQEPIRAFDCAEYQCAEGISRLLEASGPFCQYLFSLKCFCAQKEKNNICYKDDAGNNQKGAGV